jgi:hypothetical protein
VVAVLAVAVTVTSCNSSRSFGELAKDAEAVPVPAGVQFVREQRSVEDGPGFTTSKSEQVTREFSTNDPCGSLESSWMKALAAEHRRFHLDNHPHRFGALGSLGIAVQDRSEVLGITLGTDNGSCPHPFVYAFNQPH